MKKNALIIAFDNVTDQEIYYPKYRLEEDNFKVDILSKNKQLKSLRGIIIESTYDLETFENNFEKILSDYNLLILPGGVLNLEKLRQEKSIIDFIKLWDKNNKVIGSICWAAQLLISAKIINGRKISGYYSIADDIRNAGAIYVDEPAVIDDNIVSTAHYKHLGKWTKSLLEVFYSKNEL